MEKTGRAYGFIKCDKSLTQVRENILAIRRDLPPSNLELTITPGITNIQGDKLLHETVIPEIEYEGQCNYAFEARLEGADNERTARELNSIFVNTYQSPLFVPRPQEVYGLIVYERNGQYEQLE